VYQVDRDRGRPIPAGEEPDRSLSRSSLPRRALLANTIIHGLMHNKLNMGDELHDLEKLVSSTSASPRKTCRAPRISRQPKPTSTR
jgi:hypothetical protein